MQYTFTETTLPAYYQEDHPAGHRLVNARTFIPADSIHVLHYHHCTELGICLSGHGTAYIENRIYHFSAGDLLYIPPYIPHLAAADPGYTSRWLWVSMEPFEILNDMDDPNIATLRRMTENTFSGIFHPAEEPMLEALIRKLAALADSGCADEKSLLMRGYLAGMLLSESASIKVSQALERVDSRILPAIQYIRMHYAEKEAMHAENIANTCYLGLSQFRVHFRRETGMTLQTFVLKTRLASAAYLLERTDASILQVALEAGFGDISYFHRAFRQAYGKRPSEYRRDIRLMRKIDFEEVTSLS